MILHGASREWGTTEYEVVVGTRTFGHGPGVALLCVRLGRRVLLELQLQTPEAEALAEQLTRRAKQAETELHYDV